MLEFISRPCPLCGSREKKTLGKPMKIDALFSSFNSPYISDATIVSCMRCTLVYVNPFPYFSEKLLKKMYSVDNKYFLELNPSLENIIHRVNPARRFEIAKKVSKKEIKNYLEIGCGQGYSLQVAQKRGWNVYGQDISPDFAEIAKKRTGLEISVGQLHRNSFPENYFDFVYIDSVLEHVVNPVEYMKYIIGFLSPGGIIYLTLPNENSFPHYLMDLVFHLLKKNKTCRIAPFIEPYHVLGFSKTSIQCLAQMLNLEIPYLIRHYSYGHLERYKRPFSPWRIVRKSSFGLLSILSDAFDNGMNMEVIFIRKNK